MRNLPSILTALLCLGLLPLASCGPAPEPPEPTELAAVPTATPPTILTPPTGIGET